MTTLNDSPITHAVRLWLEPSDIFSPNLGFENLGYIHSVPLMFLFDTGLIGVTICIFIFYVSGRFVYANAREDRDIASGMIAFMFTISLVEHVFFHVQTWLIFGLILGIALRNSRLPATPASALVAPSRRLARCHARLRVVHVVETCLRRRRHLRVAADRLADERSDVSGSSPAA